MAHFPTEVVAGILSRLPVKPLVRFKCVSKPWCALIDGPHLIKLHLRKSKPAKNNHNLLLIDCNSHSVRMLCMNSLDVAVEIDDHPLKDRDEYGPHVVGSCDGLLLLHNEAKDDDAIWNPSTRKYRKLPVTDDHDEPLDYSATFIVCGIGYDDIHDDYKVVKNMQYNVYDCETFSSEVRVYSLKFQSWIRIQDFPYYLRYTGCYGNFACGALHWIVSQKFQIQVYDSKDRLISAIDLATEEFRLVPMPNFNDKAEFLMDIAVLDGCLCVLCNYSDQRFDVWVMKEYGVRESWTKLLSVSLQKGT